MATINSINSIINSTTSGIVTSSNVGLLSSSATTNHAVQIGNASGTLTSLAVGATNQALLGNTGADPSWGTIANTALSSATFNVTSTTPPSGGSSGFGTQGIKFSASSVDLGNSLTINMYGEGAAWSQANSMTAGLTTGNTALFCIKSTSLTGTFPLPSTSAVGDILIYIWAVTSGAGGGVQITQAAGQQIFINTTHTTLGAGGHLDASAHGNAITLVCSVANTTWWVFEINGTWNVT